MILSKLDDAFRYEALNTGFAKAFRYLQELRSPIEDGKHAIFGDDVFAIHWNGFGKGQTDAVLECHRRYVDIQYVLRNSFTYLGTRS